MHHINITYESKFVNIIRDLSFILLFYIQMISMHRFIRAYAPSHSLRILSRRVHVSARSLSSSYTEDIPIHTGQKWERTDTRMARFVGKEKEVNTRFAIDLLSEEPTTIIDGSHVFCSGGSGALGHPKVYINLDKPQIEPCGYCGKAFVSKQFDHLAMK